MLKQSDWVGPAVADRLQVLYPTAQRVDIDAGHCAHDEAPDVVNAAIDSFAHEVGRKVKAAAKKKAKEAEAAVEAAAQ